jgi:hypothetical protein
MKQLLFIALVVFAAWYGWHHYAELRQMGSHQVIVVNHSGKAIERLRITAGGQTVVVETLEDGATAKQPFKSEKDSPFELDWQVRGVMGDRTWSGGNFSHGPILLAYHFDFRDGDGVIWSSEKLATK